MHKDVNGQLSIILKTVEWKIINFSFLIIVSPGKLKNVVCSAPKVLNNLYLECIDDSDFQPAQVGLGRAYHSVMQRSLASSSLPTTSKKWLTF